MRAHHLAAVGLILISLTVSLTAGSLEDSCITGNRPGATLLFPYFEVDLEDPEGRTTLMAIHNASDEPVLAHAVLWTNWGLPTLTFDLYLEGHGVETLGLRDVLGGRLPVTGPPGAWIPGATLPDYPTCLIPVGRTALDDAEVAELKARHLGQARAVDGLCYASPPAAPGLATGYLTVDAMNGCSQTIELPSDDGYFAAGGSGLASNRNVLAGDFFLVDPGGDSAQGLEAVALVADADFFAAGPGFYTFYRLGDDARAPLSTRLRTRFLLGGAFDGGTDLLVWTAGAVTETEPLPCDDPATSSTLMRLVAEFRDQRASPVASFYLPLKERARRLAAGGGVLPIGQGFGTVDLATWEESSFGGVPPPPQAHQTWAAALVRAEGRFSVGLNALRLDDFFCDRVTPSEDRR